MTEVPRCWLCDFEAETWGELWEHQVKCHPRSTKKFLQRLEIVVVE